MGSRKENKYIASKIERWFIKGYELANEAKSYINDQKIDPNSVLTPDQSIALIKRINCFDKFNLRIVRAWTYLQDHPELTTPQTRLSLIKLAQMIRVIDELLCKNYESKARDCLKNYLIKRVNDRKVFAEDRLIKVDDCPQKDDLIKQLLETKPQAINGHLRAQVNWEVARQALLKSSEEKKMRWRNVYYTTKNHYDAVDEKVKILLKDTIDDEFRVLMKQHEGFIRWLDLYEAALTHSEESLSLLFNSVDLSENKKREVMRNLLRVGVAAVASPLAVNFVLDPTLKVFGGILAKLAMSKGEIELEASQQNMIYQMTGLMPDRNKKTYRNAYNKLANETVYESIHRYREYLNHKINAINGFREIENMTAEDTHFWGTVKPSEVIRAHRMSVIDDSHYRNPGINLNSPENENTLITETAKDLKEMVKNVFMPMQNQYGSEQSLNTIHEFIDKILFDDSIKGGEAHNNFRNNEIVNAMSNEIEIHLIVKYLVMNTKFFGATNFNQQLYHGAVKFHEDDLEMGSVADDAPCDSLVKALLFRITKSENTELKKMLGLDTNPASNSFFYTHPLISWRATNGIISLFNQCIGRDNPNTFISRQEMVKAIISHYYNDEISQRLQRTVIHFAKSRGIHLSNHGSAEYDENNLPQQHWLSDTDTSALIQESIKPFIEKVGKHRQITEFTGSLGLHFYHNTRLIDEATNARYIEQKEIENGEKNKPISFNAI